MKLPDVRSCIQLFERKITVNKMLNWCAASRSSYYYKPKTGRQGRKPSTHTPLQNGNWISNQSVVIAVKFMLSIEFMDYGYRKMSVGLQQEGFLINKKKVYRLMKENGLLYNSKIAVRTEKRNFVKYCTQQAEAPLQQLCMDIKYLHIHGNRRNALLLTVLDVYSRRILGQLLWWRIRKEQVKWLLGQILEKYPVSGITLRNDNGSQFVAQLVREFLKEKQIHQEFTHAATPEENAFIEAYHSALERAVERQYQFESIYEAALVLNRWKKHYNEYRLHGSLGNQTPQKVWDQYFENTPLQPAKKISNSLTNIELLSSF